MYNKYFQKQGPAAKTAFLVIAVLLGVNCSSKRVKLDEPLDKYTLLYFQNSGYNEYGYPVFQKKIINIEKYKGDQYVIALFRDGLIHKTYFIQKGESLDKPDIKMPFEVIYEWTGKGFRAGFKYSKKIIEPSVKAGNEVAKNPGCAPLTLLVTVPGVAVGATVFVATSVGGFVVGVGKSIPAAYEEISKFNLDKSEIIYRSIKFNYDKRKRISDYIELSPPPEEKVLSQTRFYYKRRSSTPHKVINESIPENQKRTIYPHK
jgi:hypothetical protein